MENNLKKFIGKPIEEVVRIVEEKYNNSKISNIEAIKILELCINTKNIDIYYRGSLFQKLWELSKSIEGHKIYFSQAGQDKFIDDYFFKGKENGKFVEIGAYDGLLGSNSLYFEKFLKWEGIIIEPSTLFIDVIKKYRTSFFENVAISNKEGFEDFLSIEDGYKQMSGLLKSYNKNSLDFVRRNKKHKENIVKVKTQKIENILKKHNYYFIDYFSIDVEGSEETIFSNFDFNKFKISIFSIENNTGKKNKVSEIMENNNYKLVNIVGKDEIWEKK